MYIFDSALWLLKLHLLIEVLQCLHTAPVNHLQVQKKSRNPDTIHQDV